MTVNLTNHPTDQLNDLVRSFLIGRLSGLADGGEGRGDDGGVDLIQTFDQDSKVTFAGDDPAQHPDQHSADVPATTPARGHTSPGRSVPMVRPERREPP